MQTRNISVAILKRPFDVSGVKVETPFACMIYSNRNVSIEEIRLVADWLISSGCRYVVCGGTDCEIWHDIIDEVIVINEVDGNRSEDELIMTTWHKNEPIKEVVWFWLNLTTFNDITFENYLCLITGESKEVKEEIQQAIKQNSM